MNTGELFGADWGTLWPEVRKMKHYQDLDALLKGEPKAAALFAEIPQYAKDQIMTRSGDVNTLDKLEGYVTNLLRGDD